MNRAVRVLLVDDSDADRRLFGRALARAGYDVEDAEDGSQAWERLQDRDFDVVVSDRQMPGTDGLELIRMVRANPDTARIPVIMVSAMDEPRDREVGLAAGAAEYIGKRQSRAVADLLHSVELLARAVEHGPAQLPFERALIVDRSSVARQLLARSLKRYCRVSRAVASVAEAREWDDGKLSLVVLDATLDGALAWLQECSRSLSKPAFVVVTSRPSQDEETRVSLLGAIGYLPKPFSCRQLAHVLISSSADFSLTPPRAQVVPLADASIAEPSTGELQLTCPVLNLSADGALLATAAPFAIGTRLLVWLLLDGHSIPTYARVARIQDPSWGHPAGCGVVFEYDRSESRRFVKRFVEARRELRRRPRYS